MQTSNTERYGRLSHHSCNRHNANFVVTCESGAASDGNVDIMAIFDFQSTTCMNVGHISHNSVVQSNIGKYIQLLSGYEENIHCPHPVQNNRSGDISQNIDNHILPHVQTPCSIITRHERMRGTISLITASIGQYTETDRLVSNKGPSSMDHCSVDHTFLWFRYKETNNFKNTLTFLCFCYTILMHWRLKSPAHQQAWYWQ